MTAGATKCTGAVTTSDSRGRLIRLRCDRRELCDLFAKKATPSDVWLLQTMPDLECDQFRPCAPDPISPS